MSWWRLLFGWYRRDSPGVDAVRLDLPMFVVEESAHSRSWRDADGDVVTVEVVDGFEAVPVTSQAAQAQFRQMAENQKGGLVQAEVLEWRSRRVAEGIYKVRRGLGFAFTGMLMMPVRQSSLIWAVATQERGTTGMREAVVTAQMFKEGSLTVESYEQTWADDPYDPEYRARGRVDAATLRYLSDDVRFDAQFPSHPLAKVRNLLQTIRTEVVVDEEAFGTSPKRELND